MEYNKVYDKVDFEFEYVLVTPEKAKEYLSNNEKNRKVKQRVVDEYAKLMINDQWDTASSGAFIFLHGEQLRDGQHRLQAIIKANVAMWCVVVKPSKKPWVFDVGSSRTIADTAKYGDKADSLVNSKLLGYVKFFLTYGTGKEATERPTDMDVINYAEKHIDYLLKAYYITETARSGYDIRSGRGNYIGAAIYCALRCGVPEETLNAFVECYSKGLFTNENMTAAIVFRKMLQKSQQGKTDGSHAYRQSMFKAVQEAIKLFYEKKPRKQSYDCKFNGYSEKVVGMDNADKNQTDDMSDGIHSVSIKRFVPPTVDEVSEYCKSINSSVNPEKFVAYYESNGWMVGKNKMKNWKASVRYWTSNMTA